MNSAHLTQSVSTLGGGISEVVRALSMEQEYSGSGPKVLSVRDEGGQLAPWPAGSPKFLASRKLPGMKVIPNLGLELDRAKPDILHTHGLWTYLSIGVPRWAKRNNCPYVVSPHGMLDSWALDRSRLKKKLAARLYERKHLDNAACLHALCQSEADSIRAYGIDTPVAIIPNGIDLPSLNNQEPRTRSQERKKLLFLGRVHPKKGLANALRAWASISCSPPSISYQKNWQFVIAGWDQEQHEQELKRICDDLSITYEDTSIADYLAQTSKPCGSKASVVFTGSVFGDDKDQLLRQVDAFILPSYSEGLPMSVLEAWAYELPVLMTEHCNLPQGFTSQSAIQISNELQSIEEGLGHLFSISDEERSSFGKNGLQLVKENFTWSKIATQMDDLYRWVLEKGAKPNFVQ